MWSQSRLNDTKRSQRNSLCKSLGDKSDDHDERSFPHKRLAPILTKYFSDRLELQCAFLGQGALRTPLEHI